jgi:hypothetical protein
MVMVGTECTAVRISPKDEQTQCQSRRHCVYFLVCHYSVVNGSVDSVPPSRESERRGMLVQIVQ